MAFGERPDSMWTFSHFRHGPLIVLALFVVVHAASADELEEQVKRYRKEAEEGKATAQFNYAWHLEHGKGLPKNEVEAVRWYRKAAEQDHAGAQNNLGLMY